MLENSFIKKKRECIKEEKEENESKSKCNV